MRQNRLCHSGDCANLSCPRGFAAGNESSSTVNVGQYIMRGQLSAVAEAEIQTKYLILQLSSSNTANSRWFLHCYILGAVIQYVRSYIVNSSSDKENHLTRIILYLLISCSRNDLLPCIGWAVRGDLVKKDTLWGIAADPKPSIGDS